VAAAIAAVDPHVLHRDLSSGGTTSVEVEGELVDVGADEVVLTETPREGWAVHHEGGESIALDLTLTPELRLLGLSRDVVRQVQEARKSSGLQVSDRIALRWQADGEVRDAVLAHGPAIAAEVLATTMTQEEPEGTVFTDDETGLRFSVILS
jgi:isoleucyl-tRNA synthetase